MPLCRNARARPRSGTGLYNSSGTSGTKFRDGETFPGTVFGNGETLSQHLHCSSVFADRETITPLCFGSRLQFRSLAQGMFCATDAAALASMG